MSAVRHRPRWGVQTSLFQFRRPAFWLFAAIMVWAAFSTASQQELFQRISPSGWALAWFLVLVYALPVIALVYVLDLFEHEPVSLIAGAVLWGAVAATSLAAVANEGWALVVARVGGPDFASRWTAALTAPFVEETLKAAGVVLIYLIARREIDDVMDGFVYGALCGLGFAVVEDVFYFMAVFGGEPSGVLRGFFVRVVASGFYGHVLWTGLCGIGIAYFVSRRGEQRFAKRAAIAAALFVVAVFAHFLWNSPLLDFFPTEPWTGVEWVLVPLATTVKGAPFLGFVAVIVFLARRRERRWFALAVDTEVGNVGLLPDELVTLQNPRLRRLARREMRARAGEQAEALLKRLQREQVHLAMIRTRVQSDDDPQLVRQRLYCKSLRDALMAIPAAAPASGQMPQPLG